MSTPLSRLIEDLEARQLLAANFADVIDNPYMPLIPGSVYVYRGTEGDDQIRIRVKVTHQTKVILDVKTTEVRERTFASGELVEDTLGWFAQDKAGNVWFFGEDSKQIEDGNIVGREGSFEAGVDDAEAGIIMKAHPDIGDVYNPEIAPGVEESQAEVLSLHKSAKTPFATFGDCLHIEETSTLDPEDAEHQFYAPGIGLVKTETVSGGDEVVRLESFILPPEAFVETIDNPFLPMIPGTTFVYRGESDGEPIRDAVKITDATKEIAGVTATVVRDREFVDGELEEDTIDWFAQDRLGNVWYFGEDSKQIENGEVVSTEGSWQAGVDGARAGIIMPAHPSVGDHYRQEVAPGIAEDEATVLSLREKVIVPFATFGRCLQTAETTPLEPDVLEHKFYAAGIGLVKAQDIVGGDEVLELEKIIFQA